MKVFPQHSGAVYRQPLHQGPFAGLIHFLILICLLWIKLGTFSLSLPFCPVWAPSSACLTFEFLAFPFQDSALEHIFRVECPARSQSLLQIPSTIITRVAFLLHHHHLLILFLCSMYPAFNFNLHRSLYTRPQSPVTLHYSYFNLPSVLLHFDIGQKLRILQSPVSPAIFITI